MADLVFLPLLHPIITLILFVVAIWFLLRKRKTNDANKTSAGRIIALVIIIGIIGAIAFIFWLIKGGGGGGPWIT